LSAVAYRKSPEKKLMIVKKMCKTSEASGIEGMDARRGTPQDAPCDALVRVAEGSVLIGLAHQEL
jgi:hypothetical protein